MKRISKVALLTSIVFYATLVAWSLIEYDTYASSTIAKYEARGIPRHLIDLLTYTDF